MNGHIAKPIDIEKMEQAILSVLSKSKASQRRFCELRRCIVAGIVES